MKTLFLGLLISSFIVQTSTSNKETLWKNKLTHTLDFNQKITADTVISFVSFSFKNMDYSHISDWEHMIFNSEQEITQFKNDVQKAISKRGSTIESKWERDKYTLSIGGTGTSKWNLWIHARSGKYTAIGKPKVLNNLSIALNKATTKMKIEP